MGWILVFFFFLRGGASCGYTKFFCMDTRSALPCTAIYNKPKKYPSLSQFLMTHSSRDLSSRSPLILLPLTLYQALFSSSPHLLFSDFTLAGAAPPQSRSTNLAIAPRFLSHPLFFWENIFKFLSYFSCKIFFRREQFMRYIYSRILLIFQRNQTY